MADGNQPYWQELCAAAATERDSKKLVELVDQLLKALEQRGGVLAQQPLDSCNEP